MEETGSGVQINDINQAMNVLLKQFPDRSCDIVGTNSIVIDSSILQRSEIQFVFEEGKTSFHVKTNYMSLRGIRVVPTIIWVVFFWVWPVSIPVLILSIINDGKFVKLVKERLTSQGMTLLGE